MSRLILGCAVCKWKGRYHQGWWSRDEKLAGSWGTLAPMTEVTFKVVPQVETEATLVLHGLTNEKAAQAMAAAMATSCEVTGAAHLPENIASGFEGRRRKCIF